jgi:GTP-binding protein Era
VSDFRAGFVSIIGRPNVGKSTLTNALVGQKVAITSSKPQTTRRAIRGIAHFDNGQIIIVDTPGVHRPRTLLGKRLNELVKETLAGVDVIVQCFPAMEKVGPGDRFISDLMNQAPGAKTIAVVTKCDQASPAHITERLLEVSELATWEHIIPVSALTGDQVDVLAKEILALLPLSPPLYGAETIADEDLWVGLAEMIRETALEGLEDELPHSLAVTIEDILEPEGPGHTKIFANLVVERDSQKGILIGKGGSRLKAIGEAGRLAISKRLGTDVYLSLRVVVSKNWQQDAKKLGRLGF